MKCVCSLIQVHCALSVWFSAWIWVHYCVALLSNILASFPLSPRRTAGLQAVDLPSSRPAGVESKSSRGSERMWLWKNQAGYLGSNACKCSDQSDWIRPGIWSPVTELHTLTHTHQFQIYTLNNPLMTAHLFPVLLHHTQTSWALKAHTPAKSDNSHILACVSGQSLI